MFSARVGNVSVEHRKREVGASNYNLKQILKLIGALLFGYSAFPMRILSIIGFIVAAMSFIFGASYLVLALFIRKAQVPGWTTIVLLLSFLLGYVVLMLGVVGEYLVRVINQQSSNKSYYVREIVVHEHQKA
jgi:uncharacterized membrane protein HdeD (DUF308 family)